MEDSSDPTVAGAARRAAVLRITEERAPVGCRLLLFGELDSTTAPVLDGRIDTLVRAGERVLEIDVARIGYMNASGLAVLLAARRRLSGEADSLVLTGVSQDLRAIFEVMQLDRFFDFR